MWSTNMTWEQMEAAAEGQRKIDLMRARMWLRHYQAEVDRLEALEPMKRIPTTGKAP
jgi:hypothetical protein